MKLDVITKTIFPNISPFEINNGHCFNWCLSSYYYCKKYHSESKVHFYSYTIDGGHAFIKINNLYYDSEKPKGISDWMKLPFFLRIDILPDKDYLFKQTLQDFKLLWKEQGRFPVMTKKSISDIIKNI